ncbi:hypothetical protein LINGRAHAP2_LOCUS9775 [Linum grandiflorum]
MIIPPLVNLLDEKESEVSREAALALTKFARFDNYLHLDHSRGIVSAGGAKRLVQLVYFGDQVVQVLALVLLCYVALHVPDCEELAEAEVMAAVEWACSQDFITRNQMLDPLLPEVRCK